MKKLLYKVVQHTYLQMHIGENYKMLTLFNKGAHCKYLHLGYNLQVVKTVPEWPRLNYKRQIQIL